MIERQEVAETDEKPTLKQVFLNVTSPIREPLKRAFIEVPVEVGIELKRSVIDNPMKMEITRFRRRFINVTQSPRLNQTLVGLVLFSYLLILALLFSARADMPVGPIAFLQLVLMMLAGIVASHASIAGEKDRRSWDLLQVAPVTQYQIVIGKFLGSASLLLAIQLAFLPVMVFTRSSAHDVFQFAGNLVLAELVCLASALFVSSATIFLSARMKSANAVLVTAIAGTVGLYTLGPMFAILLDNTGQLSTFISWFYHPFFWLNGLLMQLFIPAGAANISPVPMAILGIIGYLALTSWILFVTGRRLTRERSKG